MGVHAVSDQSLGGGQVGQMVPGTGGEVGAELAHTTPGLHRAEQRHVLRGSAVLTGSHLPTMPRRDVPSPESRVPWSAGSHRQASAHFALLLEELQLPSSGLTNTQIAQRLVLSTRTIDHHVSAILQKLAVTSRQQAAELALASPTERRSERHP
jgi:DNA-binding NarL/FixJ family response regulator